MYGFVHVHCTSTKPLVRLYIVQCTMYIDVIILSTYVHVTTRKGKRNYIFIQQCFFFLFFQEIIYSSQASLFYIHYILESLHICTYVHYTFMLCISLYFLFLYVRYMCTFECIIFFMYFQTLFPMNAPYS